ncbi:MAG: hypothetical protein AAB425_09475, partial [Bdellovibrionota bacterium]
LPVGENPLGVDPDDGSLVSLTELENNGHARLETVPPLTDQYESGGNVYHHFSAPNLIRDEQNPYAGEGWRLRLDEPQLHLDKPSCWTRLEIRELPAFPEATLLRVKIKFPNSGLPEFVDYLASGLSRTQVRDQLVASLNRYGELHRFTIEKTGESYVAVTGAAYIDENPDNANDHTLKLSVLRRSMVTDITLPTSNFVKRNPRVNKSQPNDEIVQSDVPPIFTRVADSSCLKDSHTCGPRKISRVIPITQVKSPSLLDGPDTPYYFEFEGMTVNLPDRIGSTEVILRGLDGNGSVCAGFEKGSFDVQSAKWRGFQAVFQMRGEECPQGVEAQIKFNGGIDASFRNMAMIRFEPHLVFTSPPEADLQTYRLSFGPATGWKPYSSMAVIDSAITDLGALPLKNPKWISEEAAVVTSTGADPHLSLARINPRSHVESILMPTRQADHANVSVARGEAEGLQLALLPKEDLQIREVTFTPFVNAHGIGFKGRLRPYVFASGDDFLPAYSGWRPSYLPLTAENGFLDNPSGANRYPAGEKGILRILIQADRSEIPSIQGGSFEGDAVLRFQVEATGA